ncbi:MAG: BrnT family toxin [Bdellovibrionota bacterium]
MFDFDPDKSFSNKLKHKIDFDQAQELWKDPHAIELKVNFPVEERFICIGKIEDKFWTAVFTKRNDNIRIISVRRARENERDLYEKKQ